MSKQFCPDLSYEARCRELLKFMDTSVSSLRTLLGDKVSYDMTQTPRSYTIKHTLEDKDIMVIITASISFNLASEDSKQIKVLLDEHFVDKDALQTTVSDWEVYQFSIDKFVEWFSALTKSWTNHIPLIALAC